MDRIRFGTAQDVFDAFDTAADEIKAAPTEEAPLAYLDRLLAEKQPLAALSFVAYLLPRRECVWWASQAIRQFAGAGLGVEDETALLAAEAWVREPGDARRKMALRVIQDAKRRGAGAMCARAAGWSGGTKFLDEANPALAEPHQTASCARAAVLLAIIGKPAKDQIDMMQSAAAAGAGFAAGGALVFDGPRGG